MAGQATESERKIAGVTKQKKLCSEYPQSDGIRSEKQWQRKDLVLIYTTNSEYISSHSIIGVTNELYRINPYSISLKA
jgi:hypothetical protein